MEKSPVLSLILRKCSLGLLGGEKEAPLAGLLLSFGLSAPSPPQPPVLIGLLGQLRPPRTPAFHWHVPTTSGDPPRQVCSLRSPHASLLLDIRFPGGVTVPLTGLALDHSVVLLYTSRYATFSHHHPEMGTSALTS